MTTELPVSLFSRIMAACLLLLGFALLLTVLSSLSGGMRLQTGLAIQGLLLWMLLVGVFWALVSSRWLERSLTWLQRVLHL